MSVWIDPGARFRAHLKDDEALPEDRRRYFEMNVPTQREWSRVRELITKADAANNDALSESLLLQAFEILKLGPVDATDRDGQPLPCEPESVFAVVSPSEVWQVARAIPGWILLGETQRKNSRSPARSAGANSAPDAALADA